MAITVQRPSDLYNYILVSAEGNSTTPISFKTITDYFQANPLPAWKFPARGDLCEKSAAWVAVGAIGTTTINTVDKVSGAASIEVIKTGTGTFTLEYDVALDVDKISGANNYFNAGCAEKIMFALKTNNPSIKLTTIELRSAAGYTTTFTNMGAGFTCASGTWENKLIDIRTEFATKQAGGRAPFNFIRYIKLTFTGGSTNDVINIDEFRLELPNPNPRTIAPKLYLFPQAILIQNSYFKDAGFTFISNFLYDESFYGGIISGYNNSQLELGSITEGGVFYINPYCVDNAGRYITLSSGKLKGLTFISSEAQGYSTANHTVTSNIEVEDCGFYNIADMTFGGANTTMKNVIVGNSRYALRAIPAVLNDFKYYYYSAGVGYVWYAETALLTAKGIKPVGFPDNTVFQISRNYQQNYACEHNFIDTDLSETSGKMQIQIYNAWGYPLRQNLKYSCNFSFSDKLGVAVSNAYVTIKNKNAEIVYSGYTDANGSIPEQTILSRYNQAINVNPTPVINVSWNPKTEGTSLNPFTLTITKEGYQTYTDTLTITKKTELEIALLEEIPPVYIEVPVEVPVLIAVKDNIHFKVDDDRIRFKVADDRIKFKVASDRIKFKVADDRIRFKVKEETIKFQVS